MNAEERYHALGRLIQEMPDFSLREIAPDAHIWLGRADALMQSGSDFANKADWRVAMNFLSSNRQYTLEQIRIVLYRALASAELAAPPRVRGAFLPVGNSFDVFAALSKLIKPALRDVLIVDPYLDERILIEFGAVVPDGIKFRLLTDKAGSKPSLIVAARKWIEQHGETRPLEVRITKPKVLHDRAIIIDGKSAWTITQSFKDLAVRSPAEIVSAEDIAELKIPAYEAIWLDAENLMPL